MGSVTRVNIRIDSFIDLEITWSGLRRNYFARFLLQPVQMSPVNL
jgi:hypothetical protein